MQINPSKTQYLFGGLRGDIVSGNTAAAIQAFLAIANLYISAAREMTTKLENLDDEFGITSDRQLIHQIKTRIKTPGASLNS